MKKFNILKYVLNPKNVGYSKAANQGINLCTTEYVFVFQADCIMDYKNIFILHVPPLFVCFAILIGARFEKNLLLNF